MVDLALHKRCLIVAPSWVGDMVMAQGLFREIKAQNPDITIDVLAPAWCAQITQFMPEVNKLIEAPFSHGVLNWNERKKTAKQLKLENYDITYVLPNSLKSSLVTWMAKIPVRVGFLGEQRYFLLNKYRRLNKTKLPKMLQRFVSLAKLDGDEVEIKDGVLPLLKVGVSDQQIVLEKFALEDVQEKVLGLCPGAEFGASKQWPAKHYAAVARYYLDQGWNVCLLGSEKDSSTCSEINELSGNRCVDVSGKTTLADAVVLLSACDLVVSNDSGLMHVAAALHKPLVAVYGSTDPGFTPPLNSQAKVEKLDLDCSPCFKRECPLEHLNCLNNLMPKQVLQATKDVLSV